MATGAPRTRPSVYLDLEPEADRARLGEPELYLPQLFPSLRGIIDAGRQPGEGQGRFLLLGSASIDRLKQSSESLAWRIRYLELTPVQAGETGAAGLDALRMRSGFPESLLADTG